MTPTPTPSMLDYVEHVSGVADNAFAVLLAVAVVISVTLGVLLVRSIHV